ncbi:17-beta-hydroxysteroid dehydrogenase 13-like isoform X2 [Frankliniella occidentalis]|uniref:17-beta-hydroxysteroid dehydrogenase 13-like isoform X2 n=1 Tax=Frankliniella occidentalis TaxID=133901 RepID=A0A6J1S091_FRAOC|nr:17-beta-hydroxysteroid dehydrogenase 13-like isoform X2 [Frankliniella occidentalis]
MKYVQNHYLHRCENILHNCVTRVTSEWLVRATRCPLRHYVALWPSLPQVTNAGRGLGRRVAVRFGLEAGLVVCWDPDLDRCMNTVYEVRHRGGAAQGYAVDATDEAAVAAGAAVLRRDVGHVHIVVLNVGRLPLKPLLRFTVRDLQDLFHDNVFPHFVLLKVFVPPMVLHNKGHVVFISSATSILPAALEGPYVATKQAVSGMMSGLREELAALPRNRVRVSCAYPCLPSSGHQGAEHCWGRRTLDDVARQIVTGVLLGRDTISVPRCLVLWMRLLRAFPLSVQRRWRRLFLSHLRATPAPPVAEPWSGPWSGPWTRDCPLEAWFQGASPADSASTIRTVPPYEMVAERSSSGDILPIGFRKSRRIELP